MRKGQLMAKTKIISSIVSTTGELLPDALVAERYKVTTRTIDRWGHRPDLKFPAPLWINGRKYRYLRQLEAWERERMAENIGRPKKTQVLHQHDEGGRA
jgi:hypothetical protein